MSLEIVTIPCLSDNYAYLLRDAGSGLVALVDAPEPGPIEAELKERGWGARRDPDHASPSRPHRRGGGAAAGLRGEGGRGGGRRAAASGALDRAVRPGESVAVGDDVGQVIDAPGHTVGHVAYHSGRRRPSSPPTA